MELAWSETVHDTLDTKRKYSLLFFLSACYVDGFMKFDWCGNSEGGNEGLR